MARSQHHRRDLPEITGWTGLLVTLLVAVYFNYLPLHLATEAHGYSPLEANVHADSHLQHHHGHEEGEHHHHDDDHDTSHAPADHDHSFGAFEPSSPLCLAAPCVMADVFTLPSVTLLLPRSPVLQRLKPPGESPPGPRQPRAPPLA